MASELKREVNVSGVVSCCFICNKNLGGSNNSSTSAPTPVTTNPKLHWRSKWKKEADGLTLSKNLEVVFLLRKVLEVPQETLTKLLVENGHPEEWDFVKWCTSCSGAVVKARDSFQEILEACKKLKEIKGEIVEMVKKGWTTKAKGRPSKASILENKDKKLVELKNFICGHDYQCKNPLAILANGEQLANIYFQEGLTLPQTAGAEDPDTSNQFSEQNNTELTDTKVDLVDVSSFANVDGTDPENSNGTEDPNWEEGVESVPSSATAKSPRSPLLTAKLVVNKPIETLKQQARAIEKLRPRIFKESTKLADAKEGSLACHKCGITFSLAHNLVAHLKLCGQNAVSPTRSFEPTPIKSERSPGRKKGPRLCLDCGITFSSAARLNIHSRLYSQRGESCRAKIQGLRSTTMVCSVCGAAFLRRKTLMNHLNKDGIPCKHVPEDEENVSTVSESRKRRRSAIVSIAKIDRCYSVKMESREDTKKCPIQTGPQIQKMKNGDPPPDVQAEMTTEEALSFLQEKEVDTVPNENSEPNGATELVHGDGDENVASFLDQTTDGQSPGIVDNTDQLMTCETSEEKEYTKPTTRSSTSTSKTGNTSKIKKGLPTCPDCEISFSSVYRLKKHINQYTQLGVSCRTQTDATDDSSTRLVCSSCGSTFFEVKTLMNHCDSDGNPCRRVAEPKHKVVIRPSRRSLRVASQRSFSRYFSDEDQGQDGETKGEPSSKKARLEDPDENTVESASDKQGSLEPENSASVTPKLKEIEKFSNGDFNSSCCMI